MLNAMFFLYLVLPLQVLPLIVDPPKPPNQDLQCRSDSERRPKFGALKLWHVGFSYGILYVLETKSWKFNMDTWDTKKDGLEKKQAGRERERERADIESSE